MDNCEYSKVASLAVTRVLNTSNARTSIRLRLWKIQIETSCTLFPHSTYTFPSFLPHTVSLKKIGMNYKLVWVWNIRPQLDWLRCAVWKAKPQCERTWARTKADGENHASQQRTTHKALSVNKMNCEALKLGLKMGENKERIKLEERHSSGRHAADGGKASENEESKNNKMISGKSKLEIFEFFT